MDKSHILTGSKSLALLGGLLWIGWHLFYIFTETVDSSILIAALSVGLMAVSVYRLRAGSHLGPYGWSGGLILLAGMILFIFGAGLSGLGLVWAWLVAIGGEMITSVGLVAFGVGTLAEKPRQLWKWVSLFLAPIYFISWTTTADSFPAWAPAHTSEWFAVLYGLGWILMGILLPGSRPR